MGRPTSGIAWEAKTIEGESYDLSHLHPHLWEIIIPKKGKLDELTLNVAVSYSIHCFTRTQEEGEQVAPEWLYSDSRESRVFDTQRWELSKKLPEIISTLQTRKCIHSGREEFITIEVFEQGRRIQYAVFFTVTKGGKTEADLNLYINSAYELTRIIARPKPVRFHVILANRYRNRAIKTPP